MPPTPILPGHTYVHITSRLSPDALSASLSSGSPGVKLEYRGPVGELDDEHVFEVLADGEAPDGERWKREEGNVIRSVKGVDGVQGAQVLVANQRVKRDEF